MNQRNNYLDIAKELGERAGSRIYQVREPSRGLHNNMSPVGTMLAKGFKGLHNYAMNGGTGNQTPFQRDMKIARRERGRKIDKDTLKDFYRERARVAQTGGTIHDYGPLTSNHVGDRALDSGPVMRSTTYEGRDALIERNRLRSQTLRNKQSSNINKVYNRTSSGISTDKEFKKRLLRRKVSSWKKKSNTYNSFQNYYKGLNHKRQKEFVGPRPRHPGAKPGNKYQNRSTDTRNYWNTALRDARNSKGTNYTRAAAKASYGQLVQKRLANPRTAAGKLVKNRDYINSQYTDKTQLRGNSARLQSHIEASSARRAEVVAGTKRALGGEGALGRSAIFGSGYNKISKSNLGSIAGRQFTEVNYKEPDYLQKAWETVKAKVKPILEGKINPTNDQLTASFNGMDHRAAGVKGFGGATRGGVSADGLRTYLLDGISELDKGRLPLPVEKTHEQKMNSQRIQNLREKYPLGDMAIRTDDPSASSPVRNKPINEKLNINQMMRDGKSLYSVDSTVSERGWWKLRDIFKSVATTDYAATPKYGTPELDTWKRIQRNEAAKSVRHIGDNIDPFHNSAGNDRVHRVRSAQDTIRARTGGDIKGYYDKQRAKIHQQRAEFYEKVQSLPNPQQPNHTSSVGPTKETWSRWTKSTLHNENFRELDDWKAFDKKLDHLNTKQAQAERLMGWKNPYDFEYKKGYLASEGANGYGLGFGNYMKASRAELGVRGLGFAVGVGGREALMNSFGVMTAGQKAVLKASGQRGLLSKLMTPGMQAVGGAYASLMFTALSGGDVDEFVTNQLSYAAGLQGWRVGSSFGGMLGKERLVQGGAKTTGSVVNGIKSGVRAGITRGALGFLGGATGFAIGMAAVQSASWAIKDLSSNRSAIRKIAKEFTTRTSHIDTGYTKQSLTAKQMALSKLAKSGLNDRAMLLGNEARTMKGLM